MEIIEKQYPEVIVFDSFLPASWRLNINEPIKPSVIGYYLKPLFRYNNICHRHFDPDFTIEDIDDPKGLPEYLEDIINKRKIRRYSVKRYRSNSSQF